MRHGGAQGRWRARASTARVSSTLTGTYQSACREDTRRAPHSEVCRAARAHSSSSSPRTKHSVHVPCNSANARYMHMEDAWRRGIDARLLGPWAQACLCRVSHSHECGSHSEGTMLSVGIAALCANGIGPAPPCVEPNMTGITPTTGSCGRGCGRGV